MHLLPLPMPTMFRANNRFVKEIREMIRMLIGAENDVPAPPAIAPVRTSFRNKFFTAKTYTSTATLAGLRKNSDSIHEHRARTISRFVRCSLFRIKCSGLRLRTAATGTIFLFLGRWYASQIFAQLVFDQPCQNAPAVFRHA